jgi:deoxyribodipyrimidine photo-lyase
MSAVFPLTRHAALARWHEFLPTTPSYAARRNHVEAGHPHVSRLSPALRTRVILEDEIIADTLAHHSLPSVEKWLQEVCWRRYWKGWLEMRPQVWTQYRHALRRARQNLSAEQKARLNAIEQGEGGIAVMDHFAQELAASGYLHNHARMWFASYWVHVERLPWELGADFFFRHLLDADPASNTLSWRWVAGLQTRGKTYLVRRSNLEKYMAAHLLDDSTGLELLEDDRVSPALLPAPVETAPQPPPDFPTQAPQLTTRFGLWLHPDDLCPEVGPLSQLRPAAIAAVTSTPAYTHFRLSLGRIQHLHTALADALTRSGEYFACPTTLEEAPTTADGLAAWAQREQLRDIVAYAPFVGPIADALPQIRRRLTEVRCQLHFIRRPSDVEVHPLAKSGFFPFWEKMKARLESVHPQEGANLTKI